MRYGWVGMNLLLQFCGQGSSGQALLRQCRRHDRFEQRDRPADRYCCDSFLCRTSTRIERPLTDLPRNVRGAMRGMNVLYSCPRQGSASVLFFREAPRRQFHSVLFVLFSLFRKHKQLFLFLP
jgi:hypothetical protein